MAQKATFTIDIDFEAQTVVVEGVTEDGSRRQELNTEEGARVLDVLDQLMWVTNDIAVQNGGRGVTLTDPEGNLVSTTAFTVEA